MHSEIIVFSEKRKRWVSLQQIEDWLLEGDDDSSPAADGASMDFENSHPQNEDTVRIGQPEQERQFGPEENKSQTESDESLILQIESSSEEAKHGNYFFIFAIF